jgi:hypothetical protein
MPVIPPVKFMARPAAAGNREVKSEEKIRN